MEKKNSLRESFAGQSLGLMGAAVALRDGGKVRRSRREKGLFSRWTSVSGAGPGQAEPRAETRRIFFAMAIAGLARLGPVGGPVSQWLKSCYIPALS